MKREHLVTSGSERSMSRRRLLLGTGATVPLAVLASCGGGSALSAGGVAPPAGDPGPGTNPSGPPGSGPVGSPPPSAPPPNPTPGVPPQDPPVVSPGPAPVPDLNMPDWAMNVPLWTWTRIPNTKLSSVPPAFSVGITGPRSKIGAWCGAGFSRARMAYVIAAAGGHGDYINNEVNAAFLGDNPQWSELLASSAQADMRNAVAYEDGRRGACHTYRNTQHINRLDRTFIFSIDGPNYDALPPGGKYRGEPLIMAFNHATGDWDPPERWAAWPGSGNSIFTNALCCKHPTDEAVYVAAGQDGGNLRRFDPGLNTWSVVASSFPLRDFAAIDPVSNTMLAFGNYNGTADPFVFDLSKGNVLSPAFGGLGSGALRVRSDAGIVYDELERCFYVFPSRSNATMLKVDPANWRIETLSPAGSGPHGRTNGWQNAWQFVPSLKGIVCAAAYDEDMVYLRTSA